ncbi:cell division protein FtsZ [Methanococcus voltae]|uniref:Cell division protein FtsZ n=3 Tax=Methanococcus voltae TaxID=2188 RepID=D7DQL4_METV3|nr:cell division protein FtsZ [Methanococcus voltae]MBP2172788.1 cell division protein FtsZ [Methanococcus voltae]MBP2201802.1 cell division protein FtsZ [Methanococcus voltae]MCS3901623.1 cell division protein FtsZ [Methanococcus voltae]MCS3922626.1 cell division protein FtsZ [Methanococcus voltae PS]
MKFLQNIAENDFLDEPKETLSDVDKELLELIEGSKARITVVGCGGAGNNAINRLADEQVEGAKVVAVNTDAQQLVKTKAENKVLIGKNLTRGLGAGGNPEKGEESARENAEDIKSAIQDSDLVFITCGLGGGTGTGSAPIVAEISKKMGALTVAVVTLPFSMEGKVRMTNALNGLEKLQEVADTIVIIPNDKLLEIVRNVPLRTAFKVADEVLMNSVRGMVELVNNAGDIHVDFADVKAVMDDGGIAMMGIGESDSEKRAKEAINMALNSPLLCVDIEGATGALIHVTGPEDMSLDEAQDIVSTVSERLSENATIIWGTTIDDKLENSLRVLLIITGTKSTVNHNLSLKRNKVIIDIPKI